MKELSYESHLAEFSWAINTDGPSKTYFTQQAQDSHALSVWGGAQELMTRALIESEKLKSAEAQLFLRFGLGRRSRAIWYAFRELYFIAPPSRDHPLNLEDADRASELLNSIYINIGVSPFYDPSVSRVSAS